MNMSVQMERYEIRTPKIVVLPDGRVDRKSAASYLGREPKTLADWHSKGIGPKSRMVGGRRFYDIDDLTAFAQGKAA